MKTIVRDLALALLHTVFIGSRTTRATDLTAPVPPILVGGSEKVCQLTGETDWETGEPTAARTMSTAGMDATDVGFPVEHAGKLLLLFGDTWPSGHTETSLAAAEIPPDDAVGVTTRKTPPSAADGKCLELEINHDAGEKRTFTPATITGPTRIKQGYFNVPSGGVSAAGGLFAFFWTNHCTSPNPLPPLRDMPLVRPAPVAGNDCPETDDRNSIGMGVLARSDDEGQTFSHVVSMPTGFATAIAVNTVLESDLPEDQQLGIFVFSSPRYRAGVPYLAYATPESLSDTSSWRFFTGRAPDGKPRWITRDQWQGSPASPADWRPPKDGEIFSPRSDQERCIGELSITWNRPLHIWLMTYNCANSGAVEARVAPAPWGPWSEPTKILTSEGKYQCQLFMKPEGCGKQRNYWPMFKFNGKVVGGAPYAPYVLNRYTTPAAGSRIHQEAIIYWIVSTWNPYQVIVMRSRLRLSATPKNAR